jgi:hypothetical protein
MATHIEAVIGKALTDHAKAINLATGFTFSEQNMDFDPSGNEVGFVRLDYIPNNPTNFRIALDTSPIRRGIFQASVYVPDGTGMLQATEQAGIIRDAFERGTKITSGNVTIRVDDEPTVGPAIQEEAWLQIPVSIPFIVYP